MSQVKDAVTRGNPRDLKRVLNIRGADTDTDTANFGGILSSADDTVQKALDTIDDLSSLSTDFTITGDLEVISTDAGAAAGPSLSIYRNSASPAMNDVLGEVNFNGEDSADNKQLYAKIQVTAFSPISGNELAALDIHTVRNGAIANRLRIGAGVIVIGATGGDPGAGKINASGYEIDGAAFSPPEVFRSTGSSITADSDHTFAHGLSAEPDTVTVIIQCTTADLNYSIGDRVVISSLFRDTGDTPADVGISVLVDGTNVVVTVTDQIEIPDKTSKAISAITLGSWEMYTKAVYFG